jgi:hypothetical protein
VNEPERPADEPAPSRPAPPLSQRERDRRDGVAPGKSRGRGGLGVFLLAGALPAAAVAWLALMPAEQRDAILGKIPEGWAGRAAEAGICFLVLLLLARVALPAFHNSTALLRGVGARFAQRKGAMRVLLYPVELLLHLLLVLVQALFAIDAILIVAAGLVLILLMGRIVKPDWLPGILPTLGR